MIKVVRIIARLNIGGPTIHTILLTRELNDEKYESILVTGNVASSEGDMAYYAEKMGVKPVFIKELGRELSWKDDLIAFFRIFMLLCKEAPDIVHTHTAKAGTLGRLSGILYNFISGIFARLAKSGKFEPLKRGVFKKKVKLVHTFHGHVFHSYFGYFKTRLFIFIEKVLAFFSDRIIAISELQAKDIVEKFLVAPAKKVSVIPLGLNLSVFFANKENGVNFRKECGALDDDIFVGTVGRLVPVKNHELFLSAIKKLREQREKMDVRFAIVGDGELRRELHDFSGALGIQDHVVFSGWQKDLAGVYAGLDIVALTSNNEGTPVSLIEAMASGKPIISTKVGGVVDLMGAFRRRLSG
jgi:glycosyltransferase involved in cell wall biosynthesis